MHAGVDRRSHSRDSWGRLERRVAYCVVNKSVLPRYQPLDLRVQYLHMYRSSTEYRMAHSHPLRRWAVANRNPYQYRISVWLAALQAHRSSKLRMVAL
jgi:hypothetical protein